MLEWDWDLNGDLDPRTVAAGGKQRVAWRCLLNPDHVWETRASSRTYGGSLCPFHMGNKVHPSESLAAYFPWLAKEWHPTKNVLRADQVARASARLATWVCELGHECRRSSTPARCPRAPAPSATSSPRPSATRWPDSAAASSAISGPRRRSRASFQRPSSTPICRSDLRGAAVELMSILRSPAQSLRERRQRCQKEGATRVLALLAAFVPRSSD